MSARKLRNYSIIAVLSLPLLPTRAVPESLTLTTYYPAPYGVYQELRATRNTYLAYQNPTDQVGIGTTSPVAGYKVDVSGKTNFRQYIHIDVTETGCTQMPTAAATTGPTPPGYTTCGGSRFATWFPGIYHEGRVEVPLPTPITVPPGGFNLGYATDGWFYCCPR